jgi:class 3 adenylate cyclase/HAMP domain-containing protein
LALLSARLINGDDINKKKNLKDLHSDSYKNLLSVLNKITGSNKDPWNKAFYAALFTGSRFEYSLIICNEELSIFRPATPLEGEDYDLFISGQPIGGIFYLDDGDWAVAEAPVYNSAGEISGMFEIGLDLIAYEINNAKLRREVALIAAAVCLVILFALSILISIVVRQLSAVANVLKAIASGNRTERVRYRARDELGKVSSGLNTMAEELQFQFDRINRLNDSSIRFVPVQFMEQLGVSDISSLKLGDNVQREMSVLFFDIRAFSISSEMMTTRENFDFINNVLGIAGPIIRRHNGFVDKYIGDAAMVLFDNGLDAVRAGIELHHLIVFDKNTSVKIGVDKINIGVGIHTGSVMMGIVGENERLSSTVISANVNLASRVESLTKQTGSGLLITRDTLNRLTGNEGEFNYRFIGMVQAAGVNEVVGLFDILDALPIRDKRFRLATKTVFESGVRKFHAKDYTAAIQRFEKVVAADKRDICAVHHLKQAKKHLDNPELPSIFAFDKK